MCRLAAYLGPPICLAGLLHDAPHGLVKQSHAPRAMTSGTLNADGWGVGWFSGTADALPGIVRGILPIWSDDNAATVPRAIQAGSILGVVRSASPGLPVSPANTPPFAGEGWVFAHNGLIAPWPHLRRTRLQRLLPAAQEARLRGTTDSEWLGQVIATHALTDRDPGRATLQLLLEVAQAAVSEGGSLTASVVILERDRLLAVRMADPRSLPPSLFWLRDAAAWAGGTVIASEPLDDNPAWTEVPTGHVLRADASSMTMTGAA